MNVERQYVYVHMIRPHYDVVIAEVEAHARFDEINSSELIKTRTRYSFSSEKLVIFANDPLCKH